MTNPILANGSVTPEKLSSEFGADRLKPENRADAARAYSTSAAAAARVGRAERVSYQFPLVGAPAVDVFLKRRPAPPAAASGGSTRRGGEGNLCVYVTESDLGRRWHRPANNTRLGFGLDRQSQRKRN